MEKPFLYFDTETTDANIKDLLQLAFVTDSDVALNLFFKPTQKISFLAMAVNHITPEMVEDKKPFEQTELPKENIDPEFKGNSLIEYLNFLAEKYIWVAHNVDFDKEVLERKGIKLPYTICTLKLARNAFSDGKHDLESYSLQFLRYYLGLYKGENAIHNTAHDALSDVYFLRDLFHYIKKHTLLTTENMIAISKDPAIIRSSNFGKHYGETLEDIAKEDSQYIQWLLRESKDEDLKYNIERILQ